MFELYSNVTKDTYGIVGTVTDITYKDGSIAHVGDLVRIDNLSEPSVVVKTKNNGYCLMGIAETSGNGQSKNGKCSDWNYQLFEKFNKWTGFECRTLIKRRIDTASIKQEYEIKWIGEEKMKKEKLLSKDMLKAMKVKKVIFNEKATIVYLEDGTKGVAQCSINDEYDPLVGFSVAYTTAIATKGVKTTLIENVDYMAERKTFVVGK